VSITILLLVLFIAAVLSGATAAISGFGIGSMLTPILATQYGMPLAVAAVSIPHALATGVRCWRLRHAISWPVIRSFGLLSAAGGLAGALVVHRFDSAVLSRLLGILLVATAIAAMTDWMKRLHPTGVTANALGFTSGFFGGIAGNQGGLRSGALLAFGLSPAALVATATATGLAVDAARLPVYLATVGRSLVSLATPIVVAAAGVLIGTFAGERVLLGLSPARFRQIIGGLIGILGIWLLARPIQ
jgi:hypothetical protein